MKTVILAALLNLALISVCYGDDPAWSIQRLSKIQSYHVGANCLNAVLAAKGYTDQINYVDDIEFQYYLNRFCKHRPETGAPGQVLAVMIDDDVDHGAISLGRGRIFDKNSVFGVHTPNVITREGQYLTHPRSDLQGLCTDCHVKAFDCASHKVVRPAMKECSEAANRLGFTAVRDRLQMLTFDSREKISIADWDMISLDTTSIRLSSLSGSEPCALYLLASAVSIYRNVNGLWSKEDNQGLQTEEAIQLFENQTNSKTFLLSEIESLKKRILAFDHSPKTAKLLAQFKNR